MLVRVWEFGSSHVREYDDEQGCAACQYAKESGCDEGVVKYVAMQEGDDPHVEFRRVECIVSSRAFFCVGATLSEVKAVKKASRT